MPTAARRYPRRAAIAVYGLVEPSQQLLRIGQIVPAFLVVGLDRQSPAIRVACLFQMFKRAQDRTRAVVHRGIVRVVVPKVRFRGCVSSAPYDRAASENWHNQSQTLLTRSEMGDEP